MIFWLLCWILQDLVPCIPILFKDEQIILWRGKVRQEHSASEQCSSRSKWWRHLFYIQTSYLPFRFRIDDFPWLHYAINENHMLHNQLQWMIRLVIFIFLLLICCNMQMMACCERGGCCSAWVQSNAIHTALMSSRFVSPRNFFRCDQCWFLLRDLYRQSSILWPLLLISCDTCCCWCLDYLVEGKQWNDALSNRWCVLRLSEPR